MTIDSVKTVLERAVVDLELSMLKVEPSGKGFT